MAEEEVLTLKVETKGAKEAAKEMTAVEKATDKANDAAEEYEDTTIAVRTLGGSVMRYGATTVRRDAGAAASCSNRNAWRRVR